MSLLTFKWVAWVPNQPGKGDAMQPGIALPTLPPRGVYASFYASSLATTPFMQMGAHDAILRLKQFAKAHRCLGARCTTISYLYSE